MSNSVPAQPPDSRRKEIASKNTFTSFPKVSPTFKPAVVPSAILSSASFRRNNLEQFHGTTLNTRVDNIDLHDSYVASRGNM